tara:strand:+ start:505 stop:1350 length:846 start_codon:yes stop_codon:yes gene_type:complete
MQNINTILIKYKNYLKKNNISSAALDTELLLSSVINKSREYLIINSKEEIEDIKIRKFQNLIERRKNREPIAYILKKKDFWKSTFYVDKNVLIPRPDTEILIQEALKNTPKNRKISILDIGTGSGCILLSLLKERKKFKGTGIDISKNALKVANFNAKIHQLKNRVKFIKSSVDNFFKDKYDLIISNPPYINKIDFKYLERDVYKFEPAEALKGGNDGLSIIKKVVERSSKLLKMNGKLILEIGYDQKFRVEHMLKFKKFYINKIAKDYGNNNRCIICTKI